MRSKKCTNPDCKNHLGSVGKNFCIECRAMIALKYKVPRKGCAVKRWVLLLKTNQPDFVMSTDITKMFDASKEVTLPTMFREVSTCYTKTLFEFRNNSQMYDAHRNKELFAYRSTFQGEPVFFIEREKITYIFAPIGRKVK